MVKNLRKSFTPRQRNIEDEKGRLLTDLQDILERWKTYTEKLYTEDSDVGEDVDLVDHSYPPILVEEVKEAIRRLPQGKATGHDDLPAELIKMDSDIIAKVFCTLCNKVIETGEWPEDWRRSVFITIPKVKGTVRCDEHRMIALISHASKILLRILLNRLQRVADEQIADVQMGFRKGFGTRDQIFNLRLIMEKARESSVPLYMAFIDYKKAFDSVKQKTLWKILKDMGLCVTTVYSLKQLYEQQRAAVRVEGDISDWFSISKGVRQGCLVSPLSFNCYSEHVMRESADEASWIGITIGGRTINNLRYADDIVLIATSASDLQQLIDKVATVSHSYGLEVSTRKTKILLTDDVAANHTFWCNGEVLDQVDSFRYLGALITSTGDCSTEIRSRLGKARTMLTSLNSLWKDRALNSDTKGRLLRALVWPAATYGCETWTVKAADKKRIASFEMTAYRRMLRISWTEHRTNQSILEQLNTTPRLLEEIQRRKLQYFGHVARADSLCTTVLHGRIAGTRKRGRPRRRWTDDIKDWTGSSLAECVRAAQDRTCWRTMTSLSQASDPQE